MGKGIKFVRGAPLDLDEVLQHLGQFGRYQMIIYCLTSLPIMFTAMFLLTYVFTAAQVPHRCYIPDCDLDWATYNPSWLKHAVPYDNPLDESVPAQCLRYESNNITTLDYESTENDDSTEDSTSTTSGRALCPVDLFVNCTTRCDEWVFQGPEKTIVNEWNLTCEANRWKLTLVGTVNNVGQFIGFPIAGAFSDRFGRKTALVVGICMSSVLGLARSFSPSYLVFIIFEFLDPLFGIGVYSSGFVLGIELMGPKKRVLGGSIISCFFTFGEMLLGLTAYWLRAWRLLLRVVYAPALLFVSYFWLLPESVRWLISKGRLEDARRILKQAARRNGVVLDEDLLNNKQLEDMKGETVKEEYVPEGRITDIFKSKILLLRVINCSFCWLTNTFVFFGLALNSVSVGGNMYSNFILVAVIEIPGYIATYFIMDRWGRKMSLFASLFLAGVSCIMFMFIPQEMELGRLILYMSGKFAITVSFTVLYVYTTEMFPTQLRHSLLGTCAMFGRLGSIVAPQTPLLGQYMESLPLLLFGAMSLIAAFLSLLFPETLNSKLPDTIQEAERINGGRRAVSKIT